MGIYDFIFQKMTQMELLPMRKLIIILFFTPLMLIGQDKPEYAVSNIPDSLMAKVNHVVRRDDETFEVLSDSKSIITYIGAITVLNQKSHRNHVRVVYQPEDGVEYFKVRIYDAAGNLVKKVKKKDIIETVANFSGRSFDSRLMKSYEWEGNNYPFTIEYSFRKKVTGISNANYADWYFQWLDEGVEESSFTFIIPEEKKYYIQSFNLDIKPEEITENGRKKLTWTMTNLSPIYSDERMPRYFEFLPLLKIRPDEFEMAGVRGSMASWEAFSSFMSKLFGGKNELPDALKKEIDHLLKDAKTEREKIDLIYHYVQEHTRYVSVQLGDGGWIPFDAAYVYENKYGDCKALTNYTYSLLNYAGIESVPTLVDAGREGPSLDLGNNFVSPDFNHVILYVPEEDCWLECTSSHNPTNYLGSFTRNRPVLTIEPEGGKLIKTPDYPAEQNNTTNQLEIAIDRKGNANISGKRTYRGINQEDVRYLHFANDEKQFREWFEETLGKVTNVNVQKLNHECSDSKPEASLDFNVKADRFASISGKRFFIPINSVNKFSNKPRFKKKRTYDILSPDGYTEVDTFIYKIPPGFTIEKNPLAKPVRFSSEFGTYEAQILMENNKIIYTRKLVILPYRIPINRKKDLLDFYKKISKWDGKKLVVKEGGA